MISTIHNKISPFLGILFKSLIILSIIILGDYLYEMYNPDYSFFVNHDIKRLYYILIGVVVISNRKLQKSVIVVLFLMQLFEYLHIQYYGVVIQPIEFYMLFNNAGEVFVSFIDEIQNMIIPFVTVLFLLFATMLYLNFSPSKQYKYGTLIGILIIMTSFIYEANKVNHALSLNSGKLFNSGAVRILPNEYRIATRNFITSINYFFVAILPKKIYSNNTDTKFETLKKANIATHNPDINVVFILGETLRAKNLSILGYKQNNTTQRLNNLEGLIAKSIYSAGTMTKTSVSALINRVKYPGKTQQIVGQDYCLFKLAKNNGFQTHLYSAQTRGSLKILDNYICKKYIDFYETRTSLSDKIDNLDQYDMALEQVLDTIDFDNTNNFIILHQRGSHSPYDKRYPNKFDKFDSQYDNTILYTDYTIVSIIDKLRQKTNKPTFVVFTSDHGELLHEHGRNGHGWFFEEVYRVPFLFYVINNKEYLLDSISNIQSHFDVSTLLTQLLGYDTKIKFEKDIYVNGSDIDALAGYLHIQVDKNNSEINKKQIRY